MPDDNIHSSEQGRSGVVSVFTGQFASDEELELFVEIDYGTEDGDDITSPFLASTGIEWYDEDFAERSFWSAGTLVDRLREHSYGERIDPTALTDLAARQTDNSLYLIYDFDATGAYQGRLSLVGVYPYTKN